MNTQILGIVAGVVLSVLAGAWGWGHYQYKSGRKDARIEGELEGLKRREANEKTARKLHDEKAPIRKKMEGEADIEKAVEFGRQLLNLGK